MSRKRYSPIIEFDQASDITEARIQAWLSVEQCIELCDITERTWARWMTSGAPRWAIRLVMSQCPTLDRFGWKDWEIKNGVLYSKQLSYRYYWTPAKLILPLFNARESGAAFAGVAENVSSIESVRTPNDQTLPDTTFEPGQAAG